MVNSFDVHGTELKTVIELVSQKFKISKRLARKVILWRNPSKKSSPQVKEEPKITISDKEISLANWEKTAISSKHNYSDDVFKCLIDEQAKQVTTWQIVLDDVVDLAVFAPQRQLCVEEITKFSVKCKLESKTTEASLVYLDRFLLVSEAANILNSQSGLKGANGKYPLPVVAICILMVSSKYEEVYPPAASAFAKFVRYNLKEFGKLEMILLDIMNWELLTSTSVDFIGRNIEAIEGSMKTYSLAMFILEVSWFTKLSIGKEISIFNPRTIKWLQAGQNSALPMSALHVAKPSEIALGCIILSLVYQGKVCYPVTLKHSTGVSVRSVSHVVKQLHSQFKDEVEMQHSSAIIKKYSSRKYLKIGAFKPPSFQELLYNRAFRDTELVDCYKHTSTKKIERMLSKNIERVIPKNRQKRV